MTHPLKVPLDDLQVLSLLLLSEPYLQTTDEENSFQILLSLQGQYIH